MVETYYQKNREKRLAYAKEYNKNHRSNQLEYQKAWREKNFDKIKEYRRTHALQRREYYEKWYKENGRNRAGNYQEVTNEWRQLFPEKVKIHDQLNSYIRSGKMKRPEFCPRCGRKISVHAHHINYAHFMNFVWLCASCHKKEHINNTA